jgi:hypothetical protein
LKRPDDAFATRSLSTRHEKHQTAPAKVIASRVIGAGVRSGIEAPSDDRMTATWSKEMPKIRRLSGFFVHAAPAPR